MEYLLIILRKLYEYRFFRFFMYKISDFVFLIKLCLFSMKNKKFIYHYGLFGINMNVGDTILYNRLEKMFDFVTGNSNTWFRRLAFGEITRAEVLLINKFCKLIVVGGHGLLMPDSNKNNNSGWGFNIKIHNFKKIKVPIIFFAIGYNTFYKKEQFSSIFYEHLQLCVDKSKFIGLRNYGSIEAIKKYIPECFHERIKYQPCPTTMTSLFLQKHQEDDSRNEICISLAFNHFTDRFGDNYRRILNDLLRYSKYMINKNYKISFSGHHIFDTHNKYIDDFKKHSFNVIPLYKYNEAYIYDYYKSKKIVISMRGHGLMIPFGLSIPVISLTTQNKQKWFIETTGHDEWNIDIDDDVYNKLIEQTFNILENYRYIINEIEKIQNENLKITTDNIKYSMGF